MPRIKDNTQEVLNTGSQTQIISSRTLRLLHWRMTNIGRMFARWVSHYLVCLAPNWRSHPLRSAFPAPVPSTHSALFLRPPRGWLTFDGWQADGSHCRHGTSSAWFHSASPPPSNLVDNIKCWSSTEHVSVCEWLRHECCVFLLRLSLSLSSPRT